MLQHVINRVLSDNADLDLTEAEDADTLSGELVEALASALFGPNVLLGQPGEPPRKGTNLYKAAKKWIGNEDYAVGSLKLEDTAVELGEGAYLGWEELDSGESRPVLGYDMPESGRFYFHRFHPDTRAFVTEGGVVVIAHTDLLLTPFGIDEAAPGGSEQEDDPHWHPEVEVDVGGVTLVGPLDVPEWVWGEDVLLDEKPVSKVIEAEVVESLDFDAKDIQGIAIMREDGPEGSGLLVGDFIVHTEAGSIAFRLVSKEDAEEESGEYAAALDEDE